MPKIICALPAQQYVNHVSPKVPYISYLTWIGNSTIINHLFSFGAQLTVKKVDVRLIFHILYWNSIRGAQFRAGRKCNKLYYFIFFILTTILNEFNDDTMN